MTFKQKIIKVGNSLGVTIPASFVRDGKWKSGEEVVVEQDDVYKTLIIKPKRMANKMRLTPEFKEWLDEFTHQNHQLLKELART